MKLFNNLLWTLPFLCFVLGYQILNQIYQTQIIPTPNLVGLTLANALKITSNLKLNLRIISEQIDQDLAEDTILSQKPAHQFIKTNQTLLVVVSKKPTPKIAPLLEGLTNQEIINKLNSPELKIKSYFIPNIAPVETCFAQYPSAKQNLDGTQLIAYFSAKNQQLVIMPIITSTLLSDIKNLLTTHNIKLKIQYLESLNYPKDTIIAQKPAAGTIIDLNQLKQVELHLAC
jgi:beta-lactam-binding protein with PASTA domain